MTHRYPGPPGSFPEQSSGCRVGIPGASPTKYPALQQNTGMVIPGMVTMGRQQDASVCDASMPSATVRAPASTIAGVSSCKD